MCTNRVDVGYPMKDIPDFINAKEFQNEMAELFHLEKSIRSITFQVTDRCNLCCSYCYQINKGAKILSIETAKKLIDYLLENKSDYINFDNTAGVVIDFIGGEPFLEVELMDQICDYFISQMIIKDVPWKDMYKISVGSNGTLYFDPKVQNFIEKYKNNLSLTITIDGNKELHDSCRVFPDGSGSYDIAIAAALDYMKRYTSSTYANTKLTIAPANVEYFYEAIVNLIKVGYSNIHSNCVYEEGWTMDHARIYYQQLKKVADYLIDNDLFSKVQLRQFDIGLYQPVPESNNQNWCGGDGAMLSVDPDGRLFNCVRYMESSLGEDGPPPLCIGTVEEGIGTTDLYQQNIQCMKCLTRRSQSTDECFYCPIAAGCSWCSGYNYQCFGTPNKRATFICDMHKAESLATAYYFNKYAEKQFKENKDFDYAFNRIPVHCPKEWAIPIIGEEEYQILFKLAHMDRKII